MALFTAPAERHGAQRNAIVQALMAQLGYGGGAASYQAAPTRPSGGGQHLGDLVGEHSVPRYDNSNTDACFMMGDFDAALNALRPSTATSSTQSPSSTLEAPTPDQLVTGTLAPEDPSTPSNTPAPIGHSGPRARLSRLSTRSNAAVRDRR